MGYQSKYTEAEKAAKIRGLLDTAKNAVKRENYNISLEADEPKNASTYAVKTAGIATQLCMVIDYAYCATDAQTWEEIENLTDNTEKIIGQMLEKLEKLAKTNKTEYAESAKEALNKKLNQSAVNRHFDCDSTSRAYSILQRIAGHRAKNIREIIKGAYSAKDAETWENIRYEIAENFKDVKTYLHREAEVRTGKVKPRRSAGRPTTPYRQKKLKFHDMEKSLRIN
jgi:hypothetical protein